MHTANRTESGEKNMCIRFVIGWLIALVAAAPALGETPLTTAFTYQGQLKQGGAPLEGTTDFQFTLWDAAGSGNPPTGGTQVGVVQAINALQVTAGLFTVTLNAGGEFQGNAFNGSARWLQIAVRSPAGGGVFTTLAPRQPLTGAPHALALPGLYTQQNAASPNLIGGHNANTVTAGVVGATISGGGRASSVNKVTDDYGTVGGGGNNQAGNAGGNANDAVNATVGGGNTNTASGEYSTVGGGNSNTAAGPNGVVAGGALNNAGGIVATIGGGYANNNSGWEGTIGGGAVNTVSERRATVGGGGDNTASGWAATVPGGENNVALGSYSFASGRQAKANHNGTFVWADTSGGEFASTDLNQFLIRAAGGVGIGVTSPSANLHVQGGMADAFLVSDTGSGRAIHALALSDTAIWAETTSGFAGVDGRNAGTSGIGVFGRASADSGGTNGVVGQADSPDGRGVSGWAFADTGPTIGVYGQSASSSGQGVVGWAYAATGPTYGVTGRSDSPFGRGVNGWASATTGQTYGVYGQSDSTDGGVGVRGSATGYGVVGTSTSTAGRGVSGESAGTSGRGVYGVATAGSGQTYGVYGESASTGGLGVAGYSTAFSGLGCGVYGESNSSSGFGVIGSAWRSDGETFGVYGVSNSTSGRGVYGWATAATGTIYGVFGHASIGSAGYGVYASGNLGASGTKPFRIDHPDDPANKYLLHYAAESPEVINFYRGTVVLDGAGEAVVELPHYFAKINKTPSYQLTAVGAPMPMLHVAEEIDEAALSAGATAGPGVAAPICSFRIAGGAPGAKVSWEVKAVRNDLWVQTRAMPVEVEKQGIEKGKYQHPELYGQPPEKGMNYRLEDERGSRTLPDAPPQ